MTKPTLGLIQKQIEKSCSLSLYLLFFALPTSKSLLYIAAALFVISSLLAGRWRDKLEVLRTQRISWFFLVIYALVLVGCLYGPGEFDQKLNYLQYYGKLCLGVLLLCELSTHPFRQKTALNMFCSAMALSALISIMKWLQLFSEDWAQLLGPVAGDNAAFKDYLIQNVMMGMFIVACTARWVSTPSKAFPERALYGLGVAIGFMALFFAVERGRTGQLGFLLGLTLICLLAVRPSKWFIPTFVMGILIVTTYLAHEAWRDHVNRAIWEALDYKNNPLSSVGNRVYLYDWSIHFMRTQDIWAHLMGLGTASYTVFAQSGFTPEICITSCPHPHSQFLFFWIEQGMIGLTVFFGLFGYLLHLALKSTRLDLQIMLAGFIGIFLADSLFHSSLWLRIEGFFSVMMIALLSSQAYVCRYSDSIKSNPTEIRD